MIDSMNKHKVLYQQAYDPEQWDELYGENLRPYAYRNFKGFVCILHHLFNTERRKFDLLVGAGDSGSAMLAVTQKVLERIQVECPQTLCIPTQRYKKPDLIWSDNKDDYFDNKVFVPQIKQQLKGRKIKNVLYADDEISSVGLTVKTTLNLLNHAQHGEPIENYTVVAEDQSGLAWGKSEPGAEAVEFYPVVRGVEGLFSVLFYVLPWEIETQINESFGEKIDAKKQVAILLNAPLREKTIGVPEFNYDLHKKVAAKVSNLQDLQEQLLQHINRLTNKAIEEYKNGEIIIVK